MFFTMMIGLPGSGKSTLARKMADSIGAVIVSTDSIRGELFGNEEDQSNPEKVFGIALHRIKQNIEDGKSVIFDATNLSAKGRMRILNTLPKNIVKRAYIVATDFETCVHQNSLRERKVPFEIIKKFRERFEFPTYAEGFDEFRFAFNYIRSNYVYFNLVQKMLYFEQDNPHHTHTLGGHIQAVVENVIRSGGDNVTKLAARFHDVGKMYTKVFSDANGKATKFAHFYHHENVGAYEAMFYLDSYGCSYKEIIETCGVIQYHMRPYSLNGEKSVEKLKSRVGEEMFQRIMALNDADKNEK